MKPFDMIPSEFAERLLQAAKLADGCVVVFASEQADDLAHTMLSLIDGVPPDAPVLIVSSDGDAIPGDDFLKPWKATAQFEAYFISIGERSRSNFLNELIACTDGDIAVVTAGVQLPRDWLSEVTSVGSGSPDAGSVSCFASRPGVLSAPDENSTVRSAPSGLDWADYSAQVAEMAIRLAPTIPLPDGGAWLFTRPAMNVLGGFREDSSRCLLRSIRDYGHRVVIAGLKNILADGIYVGDVGRSDEPRFRPDHDGIDDRMRVDLLSRDRFGAFCLAKDRSRLYADRLSLAVDCTDLTQFTNGTAINSANVTLALAARFEHVTAVVLPHAPEAVLNLFREHGVQVNLVPDINTDVQLRFDLIYRPTQCLRLEQLQWLKRIADRVVVNVLDLIAFHNPSYHADFNSFEQYRSLQRLTCEAVDGISFLSRFVAQELAREYPRVMRTPSRVVGIGLDPAPGLRAALSRVRARARWRRDVQFEVGDHDILVPGVGFTHKNRGFAIRLASEMCRRDWNGRLILVGPYPNNGSSEIADASLLLEDSNLSGRVLRHGHLDETTFDRVLQEVGLLLFPSLAEGFGLPPFEAALRGTPPATPAHGVFAEVMPESARIVGNFDLEQCANSVLQVMSDDAARVRIVQDVTEAAQRFTWSAVASELATLIEDVLQQPRNPVRTIVAESTLISV